MILRYQAFPETVPQMEEQDLQGLMKNPCGTKGCPSSQEHQIQDALQSKPLSCLCHRQASFGTVPYSTMQRKLPVLWILLFSPPVELSEYLQKYLLHYSSHDLY
uniref:Similar to PIE1 (PHOTOPERIOD-INDEPENDENT EARLY FLOWERING 1) n=1 Tax=Arundo donax TaxID=35708 RepID=A0A0A9D255_ARUDO